VTAPDRTSSDVIPLGPFRLHERIGRGGMGEVWRGHHVGQNIPVAVKVMTEARARNPKYLTAFSNEVRSVAQLDHPGIVMVFDYGEVPTATQDASRGHVAAGCPFLVMELASGGSLSQAAGPLEWPQLRSLLLNVLDALAHAHARGVIHRDLKPANILLSVRSDQRPGIKISDFGIAHARTRDAPMLKGAGTPRYMAPEQIVRRWRDHGPWTDLYALGCMAYQLASGRPPYTMRDPKKVLEAHLTQDAPPLQPIAPVPKDFEAWIRRCMIKTPQHRFRRAADAAWALMRLTSPFVGPGSKSAGLVHVPPASFSTTLTLNKIDISGVNVGEDTVVQEGLPGQLSVEEARASTQDDPLKVIESLANNPPKRVGLTAKRRHSGAVHVDLRSGFAEFIPMLADIPPGSPVMQGDAESLHWAPPMPGSWRKPREATEVAPSMQLVGAGLGLFGLRQVPIVGREEARDALWDELADVRGSGQPRLVALTGPAGVGKSRLVEWMAERAAEVGSATLLKAEHQQHGGGDALAEMLTTHLQCQGLSNVDTCRRLERMMRPMGVNEHYEWRALAEIIQPLQTEYDTDTSRLVYFPQESARFGVICRLIRRLAQTRPVVLWLDDIQWGYDALALARHILADEDEEPVPCLIVLTVQQEAIVEQEQESALFEALLARPESTEVELGPLNQGQRRELVQGLLRLSGDLANRVAERTGGNPLFAVQLVGDWVHRGVLEVGRDGFVLSPTQKVDLPDDLHAVWGARVQRLIEDLPRAVQPIMEVAAALGPRIDSWEWHVAATESWDVAGALAREEKGLRVADLEQVAIRALDEAHLISRNPDGSWSFVHGMLRESVERAAREGGRWSRHHEACAGMLGKCYPLGGRGVSERLGRHLVGANRPEEAIEPLLVAAVERRESSEFGAAQALLWLRERALVDAQVPESDPAWGLGWVLRCRLDEDRNKLDEALRWAKTARTQAKHWNWHEVAADALCVMGTIFSRRGQQLEASEVFLEAQQSYAAVGDRLGVARCLRGLGTAAALAGKFEDGRKLLTKAHILFEKNNQLFEVAHCMRAQANLAWTEGKPVRAGALYQQTLGMCEQIGDRLGMGLTLTGLGEVARAAGKLDEAEHLYRQGIATLRQLDSGWEYYQSHLALVLLARGGYREARRLLQRVAMLTEQQEQLGILGCVQMALASCAAGMEDWVALDDHLERATDLLRVTGMIEPDVAWCAELAAREAAKRGKDDRARRALVLARQQFEALGSEVGMNRIRDELQRLHARRGQVEVT